MNFREAMETNPARLVVQWRQAQGGRDEYQWGIVGDLPVLSVIAKLVEVQAKLVGGEWVSECDDDLPALVLVLSSDGLETYLDRRIPSDSLCGMLEIIKAMLVNSRLAMMQAANKVQLYGPDGSPMRA